MSYRPGAALIGLALLATGLTLAPGTPAAAHAVLVSTEPAADAQLAEPPAEIVLAFNEPLTAEYTTIVLSDTDGEEVPVTGPVITHERGLVRPAAPLPAGDYQVAYRVVSADGHPVQGTFGFSVRPPARSPVATAPPAPSGSPQPVATEDQPVAAEDEPAGSGAGWLIVAAGLGLVVVAVAVTAGLRRRVRGPR